MSAIENRNDMTEKKFVNMQQHTADVQKELSELKVTYKEQCDIFVAEVKKLDATIIDHSERLTKYC